MTTTNEIPTARSPVDMTAWDLVAAAQRGDAAAFGRLYERYVDVVFRFVLFRVADRTLAEDLTSETFLRALRRVDSVSYQGRDVGAWFVTIARNLVLDHLKCSRTKLEVSTADMLDAGTQPGIDSQVISRATLAVLLDAVDQLTDEQRECVVLRHIHGMTPAEVAAVVGCSVSAAKARTHRGIVTLAGMKSVQGLAV
jgi:RNA polymerase sigma-70 factor (ECF subfamily)